MSSFDSAWAKSVHVALLSCTTSSRRVTVAPGSGVMVACSSALPFQPAIRSRWPPRKSRLAGGPKLMAAAILGLAALLHTSALAFEIFKYVGVAYLLWMAWSTLRERGALSVEDRASGTRSFMQVTVEAILINILNPKLSIFFLAFLPQFVSTEEARPLASMLMLSSVFMLMTFVVFVVYGLLAASIRDHVISRPRVLTWMRRTFAAAFVALGAKLGRLAR